jgi:hypothetical protein
VTSGDIAIVYAALGDKDQAIAWLEKAFEHHDEYAAFMKVARSSILCAPIRASRSWCDG